MNLSKKTNRGITLIALVITIVVLLVIAGVTIAALSGENGILQRAAEAKEKTDEAQGRETETITDYESVIDEYSGGGTGTGSGSSSSSSLTDTADTKPASAMPSGATVVEANPDNGIVIRDIKNNEWVWIEVPKRTVFKSATASDQYGNIKADLIAYATEYRSSWIDEWYDSEGRIGTEREQSGSGGASISSNLEDTLGCGLTYEQYQTTYKKMLTSVYTNGGFWIGRYEAGVSDTTPRTAPGEITGLEAKSKPDMYPFNFVTCSQAQTLASAMSTDSNKTSSLMFGIQWDLVCKYLEGKDGLTKADINSDSKNWGNYSNIAVPITSANAKQRASDGKWSTITVTKPKGSSVLLSTGASNNTKKMNIYDFAGNEWEWTLEYTSDTNNPCANRGGYYYSDGSYYPASYRGNHTTSDSGHYLSFRPSLY